MEASEPMTTVEFEEVTDALLARNATIINVLARMGSEQHGQKPSATERQLTEEALQNWTVLAGSFPEEAFASEAARSLEPVKAYNAESASYASTVHPGIITPESYGHCQKPQHHGQPVDPFSGGQLAQMAAMSRQTGTPELLTAPHQVRGLGVGSPLPQRAQHRDESMDTTARYVQLWNQQQRQTPQQNGEQKQEMLRPRSEQGQQAMDQQQHLQQQSAVPRRNADVVGASPLLPHECHSGVGLGALLPEHLQMPHQQSLTQVAAQSSPAIRLANSSTLPYSGSPSSIAPSPTDRFGAGYPPESLPREGLNPFQLHLRQQQQQQQQQQLRLHQATGQQRLHASWQTLEQPLPLQSPDVTQSGTSLGATVSANMASRHNSSTNFPAVQAAHATASSAAAAATLPHGYVFSHQAMPHMPNAAAAVNTMVATSNVASQLPWSRQWDSRAILQHHGTPAVSPLQQACEDNPGGSSIEDYHRKQLQQQQQQRIAVSQSPQQSGNLMRERLSAAQSVQLSRPTANAAQLQQQQVRGQQQPVDDGQQMLPQPMQPRFLPA